MNSVSTSLLAVITAVVMSGCGGERGISLHGPIPRGPALSWTAAFVQGTQTGAIAYQSLGQTATLDAAQVPNSPPPPYATLLVGNCVKLSSPTVDTSVQVKAVASGTCTILVGGSPIQASVP